MDLYSKCVLTVIALVLSVIVLQNSGIIPISHTAGTVQTAAITKVIICNAAGTHCGYGALDDYALKVLDDHKDSWRN
jgi:hypothetical protein